MPRAVDPNRGLALQGHTTIISSAIRYLHHKSLATIHYDITEEDVVSAMYGNDVDVARRTLPMWVEYLSRGFTVKYEDELHNCTLSVGRHENTLPLLEYMKWRGDDEVKFALVHKVGEVVDRIRACNSQWRKVHYAFEYMNAYCKTPNQLRSLWPPIIQLFECRGYDDFARSLGPYKAYAPPIDLTAVEVSDIRETIPIVGMALMLPDDINDCKSFVKVEV